LYVCIVFIHKLLENALWTQIHSDCIMSVFCALVYNFPDVGLLIDKRSFNQSLSITNRIINRYNPQL